MEIKRCYDTVIGASVGENQLVQSARASTEVHGLTITRSTDGTADTIIGTATNSGNITLNNSSANLIANHVYIGSMGTPSVTGFVVYFGAIGTVGLAEKIYKPSENRSLSVNVNVTSGTVINATVRPQIIDLTAELGSTIADYIYSLESATAGSGIAKLREWGFLKGYQAFNAGSLESVEVTGKVVRGFNQWDEECELGTLQNGVPTASTTQIRSKNYCRIMPNTLYYGTCGKTDGGNQNRYYLLIAYYDSEQNWISNEAINNLTFTTPSNAAYFKLYTNSSTVVYGTVYNHDICINLSSDRNGEYEPYTEQSYDYGTDTLNGIFKLDANNQLYADGDVKTSDGTITRKYSIADLWTRDWVYADGLFRANIPNFAAPQSYIERRKGFINSKYPADTQFSISSNAMTDKTALRLGGVIYIKDSAYTDVTTFIQMLTDQNVKMVYELATPTTEQGDPFPSPQIVYHDGTEEYVTSNGVPVCHETRYEL